MRRLVIPRRGVVSAALAATALAACGGGGERADAEPPASWDVVQGEAHRVASVRGLSGPEAVRYDPDQDVYFVANFAGDAAGDANGFISRVTPDGDVQELRFIEGTDAAPLHGPRGMFITGDTLWAADADGVHGFDRRSGAQVAFVDFTAFDPGFLNDIAQGPDGALYVTDTGGRRVFRLAGRDVTVAVDSLPTRPNGITWDGAGERMLLASWDAGPTVYAWRLGDSAVAVVGVEGNGRNDGLEIVDGRIIIASQTDSSLHVLIDSVQTRIVRVPGQPADIGIDTQRRRVAVPYIALNRVDIWGLPD